MLRGLGAILEDVRLRPAQDYYDVKLVGAEAELYAVHERTLCADPKKFGDDFLGRSLAAIMITGPDVIRSQRLRRMMIDEMAPIYAKHDVLITAGPGPAPTLDAWRTIMFWQKPNITTAFNVTGQPRPGAMLRLHGCGHAAVAADRRASIRGCDGHARRPRLREGDGVA